MNVTDFEKMLEQAGFREITTRTKEPQPANGDHAHEFSVRGLVSSGEFIITCNGLARSYKAGDEFEVAAGQLHSEAVGPQGTCITTGRKY